METVQFLESMKDSFLKKTTQLNGLVKAARWYLLY